MSWLSKLMLSLRRPPEPDSLRPVRPRVSPDPGAAAALERKREALAYHPADGFHSHKIQQRRFAR